MFVSLALVVVPALLAPLAASPAAAADAPALTLGGPVVGTFFQSTESDTQITATRTSTPAFSQSFPAINFNAESSILGCNPPLTVTEWTRPFTDVILQPDGSCTTDVAQGNGEQAGNDPLWAFNAVFTGTFVVATAGKITLNFYADDGWVLRVGRSPGGAQPTAVSGPMVNAPGSSPFAGFPVVSAYDQEHAYAESDAVVDFPAEGSYPFELDYFETWGGQEALTVTANGQPIATSTPSSATCTPGNLLAITSVTHGSSVTCTFTPGTGGVTFSGWSATGFMPASSANSTETFLVNPGVCEASITGSWSGGNSVTYSYSIEQPGVFGPCSPAWAAYYDHPTDQSTWSAFCAGGYSGSATTYWVDVDDVVPACLTGQFLTGNASPDVDVPGCAHCGGPADTWPVSSESFPSFQCVELAERYLFVTYGWPGISPSTNGAQIVNGAQVVDAYAAVGEGKAIPTVTNPVKNDVYTVSASALPVKGDVVSFSTVPAFTDVGHVAIVTAVNPHNKPNTIVLAGQNWLTRGGELDLPYAKSGSTWTLNVNAAVELDRATVLRYVKWLQVAPHLAYTGMTSGKTSSPIDLSARLTVLHASGTDQLTIAGKTITFTLNGKTYRATTDQTGWAARIVRAPSTKGPYSVTVAFRDSTWGSTSIPVTVTIR